MLGYISSLMASLCWSITPLIATSALRKTSTLTFTSTRFFFATILLGIVLLFRPDLSLQLDTLGYLALSSLLGILAGDMLLFNSLRLIGPRRSYFLFSANIPLTILIAYMFFGQPPTTALLLGCGFMLAGIYLVNRSKNTAASAGQLDSSFGSDLVGIASGLVAALCQSLGLIFTRQAFDVQPSLDGFLATWLRIAIALLCLVLFFCVNRRPFKAFAGYTKPIWFAAFGAACVGNVLGMSFLTFGIAYSDVSYAALLSSFAPVFIIPWVAIIDKKKPSTMSVAGALLTLAGLWFVFS